MSKRGASAMVMTADATMNVNKTMPRTEPIFSFLVGEPAQRFQPPYVGFNEGLRREVSIWILESVKSRPKTMNSPHQNPAELQNLIQQETQKAMLNQMVAKVTKECWDKCITGAPGSKFSSSESSCLSNCAGRYLDMSVTIMKRFQSMR